MAELMLAIDAMPTLDFLLSLLGVSLALDALFGGGS